MSVVCVAERVLCLVLCPGSQRTALRQLVRSASSGPHALRRRTLIRSFCSSCHVPSASWLLVSLLVRPRARPRPRELVIHSDEGGAGGGVNGAPSSSETPSLASPLYWIATNAGLDGSVVVNKVSELPAGQGFNAATLTYGDLAADGVVDPVKVTRSAVLNAASVARMILTTETAVVEKPEEEEDEAGLGHAHHGHAH